jgi:TonB-linked SusC/RagA family outer membrane protein
MQLVPRRILVALAAILLPGAALAQNPSTISGTVTREDSTPLPGATVAIPSLGIGTTTRADGRYALLVPVGRATGQRVTLSVRAIGYKPQRGDITLSEGEQSLDFALTVNPLQLGEVVVTGAGTESEVEKLGNVRNNVDSSLIERSHETNLVTALSAKAPNVEVIATSGDPGASSSIRIRGANTLGGTADPLFVVDGQPIDNSTTPTSQFDGTGLAGQQGTPASNRAIDINPDDIESVEILKGAAAGSVYGARAGQGVVLITTKKGRPGATQYSLRSSFGLSDVHRFPELQRQYGQGDEDATTGVPTADPCVPGGAADCFGTNDSWGPLLGAGVPSYDHAREIFTTGWNSDNNLTISGGNDRTQFFVSAGYSYDRGFYVGPNNHFQRVSVRVNGSQQVVNNLKLSANVAYANTAGSFLQKGSNLSGMTLDAWRTTPAFNNQLYLDPISGLQRSFRFPNPSPTSQDSTRGYDNPFFTANVPLATSYADRVFGNLGLDWTPAPWLKFNYTLGVDYSGDSRLQGQPQTSSNTPSVLGQVIKVNLTNAQVDHNLTGTVNYKLSPSFAGTFTLGQNLNSRSVRQLGGVGNALLAAQPFTLTNTASQLPPIDNETKLRIWGYFGQATLDVGNQLFLKGGLRYDGASSFAASTQHAWFPSASAAWQFTKSLGEGGILSYGKLRAAYGEVGTQPQPYLTAFTFLSGGSYIDNWAGTLTASQNGNGGLFSDTTKAGQLSPERTREFEAGVDLGLLKDVADLSFTWYRRTSKDVILTVPVAASTGFLNQAANAGEIRNSGTEWSLNIRPITRKNFAWDLGFQLATNRNKVVSLGTPLGAADTSFFLNYGGLGGFGIAEAQVGQPIGVFRDFDYIRCGRGITIYDAATGTIPTSVDALCTPQQNQGQALFINDGTFANANGDAGNIGTAGTHSSAGYPLLDPNSRVVGDPNPKWTGSVRSSVRIGRLSLSALLDVRHGGVVYNGTRGALNAIGTSKESGDLRYQTVVIGQGVLPGPVAGPGAGTPVLMDENWFGTYYSTFAVLGAPFYESASFTKLREVSIGYSLVGGFVTRSLGFSSVDLRVSGRNLFLWTDYKGVDPETNLAGAETGARNVDWFNSGQARSFVFTVTLNR